MGSLDNKPLVLLTGPNGFVGAHVLDRLLGEGYRVRGTVRSHSKAHFFEKKYADHLSDLEFVVVPDIQAPDALDVAMTDVDYVCHVASPYVSIVSPFAFTAALTVLSLHRPMTQSKSSSSLRSMEQRT